jgi:hypothetical protein
MTQQRMVRIGGGSAGLGDGIVAAIDPALIDAAQICDGPGES